MANFTGHLVDILHGIDPSRPPWLGESVGVAVGEGVPIANAKDIGVIAASTLETNNTPIALQPQTTHTGYWGGSYNDIFYNRILIEPSVIDVGTLVTGQTHIVNVWNAYFTSVTLNTILESNIEGLVLTGPSLPTAYGPLVEQQYSLSISVDGPAVINGNFNFDFALPTEDRSISVIGSRLVLLPYWFSAPATESLVWLTDILESRDGIEQRIRLRAAPRQQFSFNAYASNQELNRVENIIYGWRANSFGVPIWSEAREVNSAVSQDDQVIQVDTNNADFRVGELALIWKSPRHFDAFEISTFTSTQINLTRGVNDDYPLGVVMPVRFGRLLGDPTRKGDGVSGRLEASFEIQNNKELTTVTPTQFLGEDVDIENTPLLLGTQVSDSYKRKMVVIDYDTGTPVFFSPWTNTQINRSYRLLLDNAEEIWTLRRWLHRRAGRAIPFYKPTYENNLRLVQANGSITTPLVVYSDEQHSQGIKRTHLAINTKTNGWLFRTILGQGIDVDGNNQIALDNSVNEDRADIISISYMGLKRLASDRIEIRHLQNCVAEVIIPITEIQP